MIRILIVEDEKPISNLIRLSLTKAGYHCTCAYDGNAAVELLDQEIFDLILLDIMLPGANGFELMDYIRPLGISYRRQFCRQPCPRIENGSGRLYHQAL